MAGNKQAAQQLTQLIGQLEQLADQIGSGTSEDLAEFVGLYRQVVDLLGDMWAVTSSVPDDVNLEVLAGRVQEAREVVAAAHPLRMVWALQSSSAVPQSGLAA